jgi:hypothetical protein
MAVQAAAAGRQEGSSGGADIGGGQAQRAGLMEPRPAVAVAVGTLGRAAAAGGCVAGSSSSAGGAINEGVGDGQAMRLEQLAVEGSEAGGSYAESAREGFMGCDAGGGLDMAADGVMQQWMLDARLQPYHHQQQHQQQVEHMHGSSMSLTEQQQQPQLQQVSHNSMSRIGHQQQQQLCGFPPQQHVSNNGGDAGGVRPRTQVRQAQQVSVKDNVKAAAGGSAAGAGAGRRTAGRNEGAVAAVARVKNEKGMEGEDEQSLEQERLSVFHASLARVSSDFIAGE